MYRILAKYRSNKLYQQTVWKTQRNYLCSSRLITNLNNNKNGYNFFYGNRKRTNAGSSINSKGKTSENGWNHSDQNDQNNNRNNKKKRSKFPNFGVGSSIASLTFLAACPAVILNNEDNNINPIKPCPSIESDGGIVVQQKVSTGEYITLEQAIEKSQELLRRRLEEAGAPGLSINVAVNGSTIWNEGLGYADIENRLPCDPTSVMRIASISKSITMAAVAQLWEEGKLDLDAPIQNYIPTFPKKTFEGKEVTITTRHLLTHQSGIRHYKHKRPLNSTDTKPDEERRDKNKSNYKKDDKKIWNKSEYKQDNDYSLLNNEKITNKTEDNSIMKKDVTEKTEENNYMRDKKRKLRQILNKQIKVKSKEEEEDYEFDLKEYYIKENFETIQESLKLFEDDELFFAPGSGFLYTSHGWTAVSGVIEGAAGKSFTNVITRLFHDLGLHHTYLDRHSPIIYNRARYYSRDKHGRLKNAPYVDNSYKWAGGGFLSTVNDLTKFGNAMLFAYQAQEGDNSEFGFLKPSTMQALWCPVAGTKMSWDCDGKYGLGWAVVEDQPGHPYCHSRRHYVSHTGGAVGASSVLLIMPTIASHKTNESKPVKGVVVAIISNMTGVGLNKVALEIAKTFENVI